MKNRIPEFKRMSKPKQTLKDIKEKWKMMHLDSNFLTALGRSKGKSDHPLDCEHEHCIYWKNNSTQKVWNKEIKRMEKNMEKQLKLLREETEDY